MTHTFPPVTVSPSVPSTIRAILPFAVIHPNPPNDPIPHIPPARGPRPLDLPRLPPSAVEQRALVADPLDVDGLGQAGFHTLRATILLTISSAAMRGLALSTVVLTQGAGLPGELQTGLLAEWVGAPWTVGAQAGVSVLLTALVAVALPVLWRKRPHLSGEQK